MDVTLSHKIKIFNMSVVTYRKMNGFSQQAIADYLDISFRKYQRIEHGQAEINVTELYKLADLYKLPISAFFDYLGEHFPTIEIDHNYFDRNSDQRIEDFRTTLEGYLLHKVRKIDRKLIEAELYKDDIFFDSDLPMAFTNFKSIFLNNSLLQKTNRVGLGRVCISKASLRPDLFLGHLKKILLLKSNYYITTINSVNNDGVEMKCDFLGFVNREENNYFAFAYLIKIDN